MSLAVAIIFQIKSAVVIERGAPKHGAVIHHAVIDVANDVAVTESARLLGDAQVAGVHKANELGRFVIQPNVGARWLGRCFPKLLIFRQYMRLLLGQTTGGVAAMTIGA